jgi:hypothetical protein
MECESYASGSCASDQNADADGKANCGDTESQEHSSNNGECECISGHGRTSIDELCIPCYGYCTDCTTAKSYKDCLACDDSPTAKKNNAPVGDSTHKLCVDECPTNVTDTTGRCTYVDADAKIVVYDFGKVPTGNTLVGNYVNSGAGTVDPITLVYEPGETGSRPSGKRGLYYTASYDNYTSVGFVMHHNVSVHFWMLRLVDDADTTLFTKHRDDFTAAGD